VPGTRLDSRDFGSCITERREHYDRYVVSAWVGLERTSEFDPADDRHRDIGDDDVGDTIGLDEPTGVNCVTHIGDVPQLDKESSHDLPDVGVVVDDEDQWASAGVARLAGTDRPSAINDLREHGASGRARL
jgi:hypothetical protein